MIKGGKGLKLIAELVEIKETKKNLEKTEKEIEEKFLQWFRQTKDSTVEQFLRKCSSLQSIVLIGIIKTEDIIKYIRISSKIEQEEIETARKQA